MLIYVSSGEFRESSTCSIEGCLTSDGRSDVREVIESITRSFGSPVAIYTSPFQQARETASLIRDCLNYDICVIVDRRLGLRVKHSRRRRVTISDKTLAFCPFLYEDDCEFKQRVAYANSKFKKDFTDGLYIFVTHGDVMTNIIPYNGRCDSVIPTTEYLVICDNGDHTTVSSITSETVSETYTQKVASPRRKRIETSCSRCRKKGRTTCTCFDNESLKFTSLPKIRMPPPESEN